MPATAKLPALTPLKLTAPFPPVEHRAGADELAATSRQPRCRPGARVVVRPRMRRRLAIDERHAHTALVST